MLCARCSHPLPPRADRCPRCFALNRGGGPGMLSQARRDSPFTAPVAMAIDSDPPAAPVAVAFEEEPGWAPDLEPEALAGEPVTEPPEPARPAGAAAAPPRRARPARPGRGQIVFAWLADLLAISAFTAGCVAFALHEAQIRYPLDFLRDTAPLWLALLCAICVAYSWAFTALVARTPGMALAGERVQSIHGGPPTPGEALARALLALPSAALGLSGFVLALFDRRGQTLHDKLCRCVIVVD